MSFRRVSRSVYERTSALKAKGGFASAPLVKQRVKIAIVEDHSQFAEFLAAVCTKELNCDIVFRETHGIRAVSRAGKLKPDVLLLDLSLPDIDGIEVTRRILKQTPSARILILSAYRDPLTTQRAREAGARGFVDKRLQNRAILTEAIRRVAQGEDYFGTDTSAIDSASLETTHSHREPLSEADQSILRLIVDGMSDPAIAFLLGSNSDLVLARRLELMSKLGITSVRELVRFGIENGFTPPQQFGFDDRPRDRF